MPKSIPVLFKRSLLAAAIISLSACSSLPQGSDFGLGSVGSGLAKAGKATADVTRKTWNKTTYLLGFSDSPDGNDIAPSDDQLTVARREADLEPLPVARLPQIEGMDKTLPVVVQKATARAEAQPLRNAASTAVNARGDAAGLNVDSRLSAENDLIHEVGMGETLWSIAKSTTGDANNWHTLADVNSLEQNATVFPGQKLVIPANLVRPGYGTMAATTESPEAAVIADTETTINADAQRVTASSDSTRLSLPASSQLDPPANEAISDALTTTAAEQSEIVAAADQNAEPFTVEEGETLWDFAKRTTGNATNWQAIATFNNFTERQAVLVRPGQTILVPGNLVREFTEAAGAASANNADDTSASATLIEQVEEVEEVAEVAEVADSTPATLIEASVLAVAEPTDGELAAEITATAEQVMTTEELEQPAIELASSADTSVADETQAITIVQATYKTDDTLDPMKTADPSLELAENESVPEEIMVSGTYYPKAVYNNADFSSSLLMRVSPGTTLQVSRALGTWFEVQTDRGVGYVHRRDIQ